jgi:hypothetical protein
MRPLNANQIIQNMTHPSLWCSAHGRITSLFTPRPTSISHPMTSPRAFSIWNRAVDWICSHISPTFFDFNGLNPSVSTIYFKFLFFIFCDFSINYRESPTFNRWPVNSYGFELFRIPAKSCRTAWSSKLIQPFFSDPKHIPSPPLVYSEQDPPSPHASAIASQGALTRIISLTWEVARHYNGTVDRRNINIKPAPCSRQAPLLVGFCRLGLA